MMAEIGELLAQPANIVGLLACAILLVAFLMRDQKLLHLFALAAWILAFVWAINSGNVPAQVASGLFVAANLIRLASLRRRARQGLMSREEQDLIAQVLAVEDPAQQRRLRDVITWRDAETGEVLIRQGQAAPPLIYIAAGKMEIEHDGLPVGNCGPDDFIGEMSLFSGEGASATVKVSLPARIAVFDRDGLLRLSAGMPELARALDRRLNRGLAAKIQRMNKAGSQR